MKLSEVSVVVTSSNNNPFSGIVVPRTSHRIDGRQARRNHPIRGVVRRGRGSWMRLETFEDDEIQVRRLVPPVRVAA